MKKLYFLFAALVLQGSLSAKPVDLATAKRVGYNFLKSRVSMGELQKAEDMQLVYGAASASANPVNYYYVFNAGNSGFVMVAADDQVVPVFGYSDEQGFDPGNIPSNAVGWYKHYADQIRYVIEHNIPATDEIRATWKHLIEGKGGASLKTTSVSALLTTSWNQSPHYNDLCPTDGTNKAVTGCVATAMAQVMKYWNYPLTGAGTHTYTSGFGPLSANFAATTYKWGQMLSSLTGSSPAASKSAVATLMQHAGVSVEMNYGIKSSGAYVTSNFSPVTHCAEYALKTYFKYDNSVQGIEKWNMSEQQWVAALQTEMDESRPVIYAGYTVNDEGHCWVADGYNMAGTDVFFHINWGWGGISNGYYKVGAMNPPALGTGGGSGGGFDYSEHAIIGIKPKSNMPADMYEPNNTATAASKLTFNMTGITGQASATGSIHIGNDKDYYYISLPADGHRYKVSARLHDAANSTNGNTYTLDAQFASSRNQTNWSAESDTILANDINATGGSNVYFRVSPKTLGETGTYLIEVNIADLTLGVASVQSSDVVSIYPNPASDVLHINLGNVQASEINLTDLQGRSVRRVALSGQATADISVADLAAGIYLIRIQSDKGVVTRKITVGK